MPFIYLYPLSSAQGMLDLRWICVLYMCYLPHYMWIEKSLISKLTTPLIILTVFTEAGADPEKAKDGASQLINVSSTIPRALKIENSCRKTRLGAEICPNRTPMGVPKHLWHHPWIRACTEGRCRKP